MLIYEYPPDERHYPSNEKGDQKRKKKKPDVYDVPLYEDY